MLRRGKLHRVAFWLSTGVLLGSLALMVATNRSCFHYRFREHVVWMYGSVVHVNLWAPRYLPLYLPFDPPQSWRERLGLIRPHVERQANGGYFAVIPLWVLIACSGGILLLLRIGRRTVPANCCRHCGYDLTGNVSGTCPECGHLTGAT